MNIHDWTLRASTHERPPCVLRHMGNAYAVAHIFTHTLPFTIETAAIQFSAVWQTLTYATQWRIHKFLYSQYIGSSSSRPLLEHSVRFASPTGRSIFLSWLSILYSQYTQLIVGILAAPQVSHCLRAAFGSHHRREGQTLSVDWGFLPSYLSVDASLHNVKYWI